jgi:hypothetical protein
MSIYYLYVKTHKKTGLKYLGYTKQNPHKYFGSGVDWRLHLSKYGYTIHTEILFQSSDKAETIRQGIYYSSMWNIVTGQDDFGNKIWANKIIETGGGQGRKPGTPTKPETIELIRKYATGRVQSEVTKAKRRIPKPGFIPWNKNIPLSSLYTKEELSVKYGTTGVNNPSYGKEVPKKECPHCNKHMDIRNYARYHGDKCKLR